MSKKKGIILTLAIISVIAITAGVTYAFFNYVKEGTTENTITTGTITFLYTETSEVGRGIMLKEAYPISDGQGKSLTGEGNVFDFKITSSNTLDATIPYEITARKKSDSSLPEEAVRIYLTKVNGTEEEVLLDNYSELDQTEKVQQGTHIEKTLYTSKVPANEENYEQEYRLRMWVDEDVDFSPDENNNYPYNNKTFTITVNVYANAKVVTDEEIENASKAEISNISIGDTELTKVENQNYDYEATLPEGTTSTTIDIETDSPNATVEVERINSLAYSSNIKRLSTKKTLDLTPGDNYFKITVISENKEVENEFTLKITVPQDTDNTLKSLSLTDCPLNETFNKDTTNYTCTVENNATSTTVSAESNSTLATVTGIGSHSLTPGENPITITVKSESGDDKTYTIIVTKPVQAISLKDAIFNKYTTIKENPSLKKTSEEANENGLYKSTATNTGDPTYYFRGNVENYVDFAGFTWRVVRINEDGTIRLIMTEGINDNATDVFNSVRTSKENMYYSNSDTAKPTLEAWYSEKIASNSKYSDRVVSGNYFCEEAKAAYSSSYATNSGASMTVYSNYTPDFTCEKNGKDGNGKGYVAGRVGLITYDEVAHAGGYFSTSNSSYYLYTGKTFWTMSPAGFSGSSALVWYVSNTGYIGDRYVDDSGRLRPVLNLKADTTVTGLGTSDSHWSVAN